MTTGCSPVDSFDRGIEQFRSTVCKRMPFTFIAYRSLIPKKGDDWYYLAEKTAWLAFITFHFVEFAGHAIFPVFFALPFVPLILDAVWMGTRHFKKDILSPCWLRAVQMIGFVAFSAMGIAIVFQKVRPA